MTNRLSSGGFEGADKPTSHPPGRRVWLRQTNATMLDPYNESDVLTIGEFEGLKAFYGTPSDIVEIELSHIPSRKMLQEHRNKVISHLHQPTNDPSVSQLETMKATLEESQSYVPGKIAQVVDALESGRYLSRQRRHQMAQTLSRVQDALGRGFKKVGDGIAALLKAVKDGLLPETKGYKALQENFAEFLEGISHLSTLHDLAVKAYSKGLISENAKNEAFATGVPLAAQANNFLGLIQARIKRDPKAYHVFLDILRSEPAYKHLVSLAGGG